MRDHVSLHHGCALLFSKKPGSGLCSTPPLPSPSQAHLHCLSICAPSKRATLPHSVHFLSHISRTFLLPTSTCPEPSADPTAQVFWPTRWGWAKPSRPLVCWPTSWRAKATRGPSWCWHQRWAGAHLTQLYEDKSDNRLFMVLVSCWAGQYLVFWFQCFHCISQHSME